MVSPERPDSLVKWLTYLGTTGCTCDYQWGRLGRLYGVSFGWGWLRMTTRSACPFHGVKAQADWDARHGIAPRPPVG